MRRSYFLFALAGLASSSACSSNPPAPVNAEDAAVADTTADVTIDDTGGVVVDTGVPSGRVLLLRIYFPEKRCFDAPTEIGHYDENEDGTPAPCAPGEVCYQRKDGVLAYHNQDCIHGANFRANWDRLDYSDLGPCEPLKHSEAIIKDCPISTCAFARDLTVDTAKMCLTAITTKGCDMGKPKSCFCDGKGGVFLPASATSSAPSGFSACDSTDAGCKSALDGFDALKPCAAAGDAGADASSG